MLIVAALVAVVASPAMAGYAISLNRIEPLGTAVSSTGFSITADGKYVVGYDGGGITDRAFLWTATGGTAGPMVAGSYMATAKGISYGSNTSTLWMGGTQSSGQVGLFRSTDSGASWSRPWATSGSAPGTGFNCVGYDGTSDQAWIGWAEGTTSYSITATSGTTPYATATSTKGVTEKNQIWGVSNTGRAAASRKDSADYRSLWLSYVTGNGTAVQNFITAFDGTQHGVAYSMSGDGTKVFGQAPKTGATDVKYGYKYVIGGGAMVALPEIAGTGGSVSRAVPYGASADGNFVVGMQYVGMEKAALWYNLNDSDSNNWKVLDLTQWASDNGILDGFTGNLRRAYSVGVNADGKPVITGMGVYYAPGSTVALTRGFVLTVPEPATMAFLALGGLALLRRRR